MDIYTKRRIKTIIRTILMVVLFCFIFFLLINKNQILQNIELRSFEKAVMEADIHGAIINFRVPYYNKKSGTLKYAIRLKDGSDGITEEAYKEAFDMIMRLTEERFSGYVRFLGRDSFSIDFYWTWYGEESFPNIKLPRYGGNYNENKENQVYEWQYP